MTLASLSSPELSSVYSTSSHTMVSSRAGSVSPTGVSEAVKSRYDLPLPVSRIVCTVILPPDVTALPPLVADTLMPVTGSHASSILRISLDTSFRMSSFLYSSPLTVTDASSSK